MNVIPTLFFSACLAWFRGEPSATELLHRHLTQGNETQVAEVLRRGANVDGPTSDGRTPLMLAAERGDVRFATMLLEKGASASRRDANGRTALDIARVAGHAEFADFLARRGAPGDPVRFGLRAAQTKTVVHASPPYLDDESACTASLAMADISLARSCPAGMRERSAKKCSCEPFFYGTSCRAEVSYRCEVPRTHGGLDLLLADFRGAGKNAPPTYVVHGPQFVLDLAKVRRELAAGNGSGQLYVAAVTRAQGDRVLWEAPFSAGQDRYTVKLPSGAGSEFLLAVIREHQQRANVLWLARIALSPTHK